MSEKKNLSPTAVLLGLVAGAMESASLSGLEPPKIPTIKSFTVVKSLNQNEEVNGVHVGLTFPKNTLFATMPIGIVDGQVRRGHDYPTRVGSWGRIRQTVDTESPDLTKMPLVGVHVGLPKDRDSTTWLSNVPAGYVQRFDESVRTLDDVFKHVCRGLTPELVEGLRKSGYVFDKDIRGVKTTLLAIPVTEDMPLFIFGYVGENGKIVFNPDEDRWSFMQRNPTAPVRATRGPQTQFQVRGGPIQPRAKLVSNAIWKQVAENPEFIQMMGQVEAKPRAQRLGATTLRAQRQPVDDLLLPDKEEETKPEGTTQEKPVVQEQDLI